MCTVWFIKKTNWILEDTGISFKWATDVCVLSRRRFPLPAFWHRGQFRWISRAENHQGSIQADPTGNTQKHNYASDFLSGGPQRSMSKVQNECRFSYSMVKCWAFSSRWANFVKVRHRLYQLFLLCLPFRALWASVRERAFTTSTTLSSTRWCLK